jgi:hypothetical protein
MSEEAIAAGLLRTRVIAYSLTASATLAAMPTARASIIYSGSIDLLVEPGSDQHLSLTGNGDEFRFFHTLEQPTSTLSGNYEWVEGVGDNFFKPARLNSGQSIDSSIDSSSQGNQVTLFLRDSRGAAYGPFSNEDVQTDPQLRTSARGYLPVRLDDGTHQYHYGWVDYMPSSDGVTAHIFGYAYESQAGAAIAAGAVPEPEESAFALGLLALGAAGLHRFRRNRALALNSAKP